MIELKKLSHWTKFNICNFKYIFKIEKKQTKK